MNEFNILQTKGLSSNLNVVITNENINKWLFEKRYPETMKDKSSIPGKMTFPIFLLPRVISYRIFVFTACPWATGKPET